MTPEQPSRSEALRRWAIRLLDENNSLGETLLDYANAWRDELAAAIQRDADRYQAMRLESPAAPSV